MTGMPSDACVRSLIRLVVSSEVVRLRGPGGLPLPDPTAILDTAPLDEPGFGIDSLEQLGVHSALCELFGVDRTPLIRMPGRAPSIVEWAELIANNWQRSEPALWLRSSGTMGSPKLHRHRVADLVEEAVFFADLVGPRSRVLALVPAEHIYGLIWTLVLPDLAQTPVLRTTAADCVPIASGDLVIATAEQWRSMLRSVWPIPDDVVGVNAAAALDLDEMRALLNRGLARMIDVYGASETGGIGFREPASPTYRLLPRWTFVPADQELGAERQHIASSDGAMIELPDTVVLHDGSFALGSRRDGAVQIGGHNVDPAHVAALLRTHAKIDDAAVRLGANGRLKAFLVSRADIDADELIASVASEMIGSLPAYARPVAYRVGAELPRNNLGKPGDWQ